MEVQTTPIHPIHPNSLTAALVHTDPTGKVVHLDILPNLANAINLMHRLQKETSNKLALIPNWGLSLKAAEYIVSQP